MAYKDVVREQDALSAKMSREPRVTRSRCGTGMALAKVQTHSTQQRRAEQAWRW